MSEEEDMESGSPTEAGPARALVEKGRAARRRLDAVFNELMQECRHSAPGARLSARLRNTLESLGLVLAFLQDQDQEQDRVFLARPRPRLTVQDLSKNKT
ncbi:unnamed protein product [Plutella xylostella]|uniref:(diamondback moth) hypothetical protein n=1 Tax=Plutella xylostella TaxID=51655 RepID=A0A8S4G2Y9_PLUXY|nr:unnamed protein product [Plutella xylostella]